MRVRFQRFAAGELPAATVDLARALIGAIVVRDTNMGRAAGRIVETEAYGIDDPASHAYGGRRTRNAAMFLSPLHAYVYLIYGTSLCFNVTSEDEGVGAAVLVRALEPIAGIDLMEARRGPGTAVRDLCRGPGRLTRALEIDRSLDGVDLIASRLLWLARSTAGVARIGSSRRIGITRAAHRRLRFYERGSVFLSGPRHLSP